MYCPQCAAQNTDNAKYCRGCGTDLEVVALVLTNKISPPRAWLEKYGEGRHKVIKGVTLLGAALLIGGVPALFLGVIFPLVMLWTVFFGWLAAWGIVSLATGLGEVVKAKTMLRQINELEIVPTPMAPQLSPAAYEGPMLDGAIEADPNSPSSVTEHTTKLLGEKPSE